MRDIKFRIWDNLKKEYCNTGEVIYSITDGNLLAYIDGESDICESVDIRSDRFTIEQFTGIYDINKREIYEGDIIYCHEYNSHDKVINQTFERSVVSFSNGCYYYYPNGNMKCPHQLLMYAYKAKILGNIHEDK